VAFSQPAFGNRLIKIGKSQRDAGVDLIVVSNNIGNVANSLTPSGRVSKSLQSVRAGLLAVRALLAPVVTAFRGLATILNGVTVPTVVPSYSTYSFPVLGNITFVTDLVLGTVHPLVLAGTKVTKAADQFEDVRAALRTMATAILRLRIALPSIRKALERAADRTRTAGKRLTASGEAMIGAGESIGGTD
jgi:hypothetical protein